MRPGKLVAVLLAVVATTAWAKPPRLTLIITVDAFGSDVMLRMRPRMRGGIASLLNQGAVFPTARYDYAKAVTAAGHATLATGANPWRHGIVANRVLNRTTGKKEPIFFDPQHPALEVPSNEVDDTSPVALMAETVADRLRTATQGRGKVISISAKARAAIAMGGHLGQAWWFDEATGKFVTGTYYAKEFPAWVKAFNDKRPADALFGKDWGLMGRPADYVGEDDRAFEADYFGLGRTFPHRITGKLPAVGPQFYAALAATPDLNDLEVQLAKAAIDGEQLGRDDIPDILAVSLSSTDRVYHLFGPYSWEMQDAVLRTDKQVADLIALAERAAGGRQNVLVVLAADHGGAAVPEEWAAMGLPAGRINPDALSKGLAQELQARFGANDLVQGIEATDVYLSSKALADRRLDVVGVRRTAAQWLSRQPGVAFAVGRDDVGDPLGNAGYNKAIRLDTFPDRGGDVTFIPRQFFVVDTFPTGTTHDSSPYAYDTQVPVIFSGHNVRPGFYPQQISPVDVAPTITNLLEMGMPAQCEGSPRPEVSLTRGQ